MKYFEDFAVGQSAVSEEYLVSAEEIIEFGKRWDPLPFHTDAEEAKKWPLGLIASGLHSMAISVRLGHGMKDDETATVAGLGWDEVRMHLPVRPGDRLRLRARVSGKRRSRSKPDRGIITYSMELLNQDRKTALSYRTGAMVLCAPAPDAAE